MPETFRKAVHSLIRAAGAQVGSPFEVDITTVGDEIASWLSVHGESLIGTSGGPFPPTENYVTTCRDDVIYLHILDWDGSNQIALPAITDRLVLEGRLLTGEAVRVEQYPWLLLVVVPEEQRPDDIDTIVVLRVEGEAASLARPIRVEAKALERILLRGGEARLSEALTHDQARDWVEGWSDSESWAEWLVRLDEADDYHLRVTYACPPGREGREFAIINGESRVTATTRATRGYFGPWENFERVELDGTLRLGAGDNHLRFSVTGIDSGRQAMRLHSLELIPTRGEEQMAAATTRARKARVRADWFRTARYGVMVHWTPQTQPRHGPPKAFPEAVQDFDARAWAEMIQQTGASYVVFTAVHGWQWWPAPIRAVERVLPGRTCRRDLIGDIADELDQRGIKLILYYHHGTGDYRWSKASGFYSKNKRRFFTNEISILTEAGHRYGRKVAGWWFDDRYPLQPFEELNQAAKAGNPDRIVAFNSWILPKLTEFQDYYAGENGPRLPRLPGKWYFTGKGPQSGLQPHALICLDDNWNHTAPESPISPPLFADRDLIACVQDANAKGAPLTLNIGVYQDGTASPATISQLLSLRQAVQV